MTFALIEVEATAKKAARGAGYSWGLAEEAAKAARWLCVQGMDGCAVLARLLEQGFGTDLAAHVPASLQSPWQGDKSLCALASGASLSDCAARLDGDGIRLKNVTEPALLLPFAATAARRNGGTVTVTCDGVTAVTDGRGVSLDGEMPRTAAEVSVSFGGTMGEARVLHSRATPAPDAWDSLNKFAHATYAPDTEESRLLGAGAGLTDND